MKQIKTIMATIEGPEAIKDFDNKVNELLAEGWTLVKRELLPAVDFGCAYQPHTLYAEMEEETITDAERCCENCKHFDLPPDAEPCTKCDDNASRWEPCEP
jgi:hypothetical protein